MVSFTMSSASSFLISDVTPIRMPKIHYRPTCTNSLYHPMLHNLRISLPPLCSTTQPTIVVEESEGIVSEVAKQKISWAETDIELTEEQAHAISQIPPKMSKRCKAFMKRIVCLSEKDRLPLLVSLWAGTMKPRRADWLVVLKELKKMRSVVLLDVMECALVEESFEANVRDYTKLIDSYAKEYRLHDAENTLSTMKRKGFMCDQVTLTVLVHMYSKAGDISRAKETFEDIKLLGAPVDRRAYDSMIMAYVRAGMPEEGENVLAEMDGHEIYAGREVYKALLKTYSTVGNTDGAQRVFDAIQLAGIVPDAKICALLVNAYCVAGQTDKARSVIENMKNAGIRPNDKCVALMVSAYEKENKLEKAIAMLTEQGRDGGVVGREASEVLLQWLSRLGLVDEISHLLDGFFSMEQGRSICTS